jgi:hypothetical protein
MAQDKSGAMGERGICVNITCPAGKPLLYWSGAGDARAGGIEDARRIGGAVQYCWCQCKFEADSWIDVWMGVPMGLVVVLAVQLSLAGLPVVLASSQRLRGPSRTWASPD